MSPEANSGDSSPFARLMAREFWLFVIFFDRGLTFFWGFGQVVPGKVIQRGRFSKSTP